LIRRQQYFFKREDESKFRYDRFWIVPVQGQLHADLHVKENIISEISRNESMEVQEKKGVSL